MSRSIPATDCDGPSVHPARWGASTERVVCVCVCVCACVFVCVVACVCVVGGEEGADTSERGTPYTGHVWLAMAAVAQLATRRSRIPKVGSLILSCRTLS